MATIELKSSGWTVGTIRITYTASNGTLKITEIEGKRDTTRSWNENDTTITVSVGGVSKSISLSHYVDFKTSWVKWGATETSWTGLSGTSISISTTMQSGTPTYSGHTFTGNATMSWSKYNVYYKDSGNTSSVTKTHGTAITLKTPSKKNGYTFKCWNTKSDDTGIIYNAGDSYTANANITLYAIM